MTMWIMQPAQTIPQRLERLRREPWGGDLPLQRRTDATTDASRSTAHDIPSRRHAHSLHDIERRWSNGAAEPDPD
jgi:hypothetical protein